MYSKPHGHTFVDIITACAIFGAVVIFILFLMNPIGRLEQARDAQREEGVKDITESVLQLQRTDPEQFSALLNELSTEKRMIGTGDSCAGSFGVQCSDEVLRNDCLDVEAYLPNGHEKLPVERGRAFSTEQSGYTLSYDGLRLAVAACRPQARSVIEIVSVINE